MHIFKHTCYDSGVHCALRLWLYADASIFSGSAQDVHCNILDVQVEEKVCLCGRVSVSEGSGKELTYAPPLLLDT